MKNIRIIDVRAKDGDSAFLIDDGKTAIVYDSGFAFTGFEVVENIKKVLGERKVDFIFLTHSHYDHALGSCYITQAYPNAKVVAGAYASKIFAKPTAKTVMRDLDNKFALSCGITNYVDLIDNLKVDIAVEDGDTIKAGDLTFTCIALPGHTKCSVGYYCKEKKLLLGCETLGVYDGVGSVIPAFLVGYEMTMQSIAKAKALDVEFLLSPHFGILDKQKTKQYFVSSEIVTKEICFDIANKLKSGVDKQTIVKEYIDKVYLGYIKQIYPIDAITLNTTIMVDLIEREVLPSL